MEETQAMSYKQANIGNEPLYCRMLPLHNTDFALVKNYLKNCIQIIYKNLLNFYDNLVRVREEREMRRGLRCRRMALCNNKIKQKLTKTTPEGERQTGRQAGRQKYFQTQPQHNLCVSEEHDSVAFLN